MELLLEATLDTLTVTAVSGLTQKHLKKREEEGNSTIWVGKSTLYQRQNFFEACFYARSSFGSTQFIAAEDTPATAPNGWYTVVIRFYGVEKVLRKFSNYQIGDISMLRHSEVQKMLRAIVHNCDAKFYSDDMSFYWQGVWEDLYKEGMSIFKFTGTKGKGVWRNIHAQSGDLANPRIRLTKHIAQIIRDIDIYIPRLEQKLEVK